MPAIMEGTRYAIDSKFRNATGEMAVIYLSRDINKPGQFMLYMANTVQQLIDAGFSNGMSVTYEGSENGKINGKITGMTLTGGTINGKVASSVITVSYSGPTLNGEYSGIIYPTYESANSGASSNIENGTAQPSTVSAAITKATTVAKTYWWVGALALVGGIFIYTKYFHKK